MFGLTIYMERRRESPSPLSRLLDAPSLRWGELVLFLPVAVLTMVPGAWSSRSTAAHR